MRHSRGRTGCALKCHDMKRKKIQAEETSRRDPEREVKEALFQSSDSDAAIGEAVFGRRLIGFVEHTVNIWLKIIYCF